MTRLPDSLSRKAVKRNFTNVPEATWEYLFDYEKQNGLHEIRVPGPGTMKRPYYDTEKLMKWLVNAGYYTEAELSEPAIFIPRMGRPSVVHRLV